MDIITQNARHRQRMLKYFYKHGGTKTAIRYKTSRKTVYKWVNRYDSTLESLKDQSRKPHKSPNGQTVDEVSLVKRIWTKDKGGDRLVMWHNARQKGYKTRLLTSVLGCRFGRCTTNTAPTHQGSF